MHLWLRQPTDVNVCYSEYVSHIAETVLARGAPSPQAGDREESIQCLPGEDTVLQAYDPRYLV